MDTQPIYELRERLRAASIAGTNLLSEDFRLKRAYEAFQPLEAASPVFAKIGQLAGRLVSQDCTSPQGTLLDALSLADAVICTLGAVDAAGELQPLGIPQAADTTSSIIVNAPYSTLKELLDALTASASGRYGYVYETHESQPELFRDYRVKYALVQALGASYAELANDAKKWLSEDGDKMILPLLYKDFDPEGKKEMVRRLELIDAIAGAGANDFYIKMLDKAQKDIRLGLISALRHVSENVPMLIELTKTEKGKNKEAAIEALGMMDDERAAAYFRETAGKKPETALKFLKNARTAWAAELTAEICSTVLEKFDKLASFSDLNKKDADTVLLMYHLIRALFGKNGSCICDCYRELLKRKERINHFLEESRNCKDENLLGKLTWKFDILQDDLRCCERMDVKTAEGALGMVLKQTLLANPAPDLQELAMQLYGDGLDANFLSAAVIVKFLRDEDCTDWLSSSVSCKLQEKNIDIDLNEMVRSAVVYVGWNGKDCGYRFYGKCNSSCLPELQAFESRVKLSHAGKIMAWFQRFHSDKLDDVLMQWIPLSDENMRTKMGEYFYKRALEVDNLTGYNKKYLDYMMTCGWKECKGLGVKAAKSLSNHITTWEMFGWLTMNSWDKDAVMAEAIAVRDMARSGEIGSKAFHVDDFERYMKDWYDKQ